MDSLNYPNTQAPINRRLTSKNNKSVYFEKDKLWFSFLLPKLPFVFQSMHKDLSENDRQKLASILHRVD